MFPPLPTEEAFDECRRMLKEIADGSLCIKTAGRVSKERAGHGVMLGAMICSDCGSAPKNTENTKNGSAKKVVLRTISGISQLLVPAESEQPERSAENSACKAADNGQAKSADVQEGYEAEHTIIYVPPVVKPEAIEEALQKNDARIHELTDEINRAKSSIKSRAKSCLKKELKRRPSDTNISDTSMPDKCAPEKKADISAAQQGQQKLEQLVITRNALCLESQKKVFELYSFFCADGKKRSLNEICQNYYGAQSGKLPPTGTGDCCAPKLLNYAFANGLTPLSMCEVFYGQKNTSKVSGMPYPPCNERCGIILPEILGLNILYRDNDIVVVNKQSGVLSVPGRGPDKQDCIVNRLRRLFPKCIEQPSVHRLDMETSGLMVLALNAESQRNLRIQFEKSEIQKKYTAVLDGNLAAAGIKDSGQMELYFRLDVENRPHQIWDSVNGKKAITQWRIIGVEKYTAPGGKSAANAKTNNVSGKCRTVTRVEFIPLTGRTHQLRLASADSHGFGIPIIGDTLYGKCEQGERLLLHASYLSFTHPATGKKMEFICEPPF